MGYQYGLIEAHFLLPGRHLRAVLESLQRFAGLEEGVMIPNVETLADVFHHFPGCWSWNVDLDREGSVIGLVLLYGSLWRLTETTRLFEVLAPFVVSGSIIRVRGEDGDVWRWEFDGQFMQIIEESSSSDEEE